MTQWTEDEIIRAARLTFESLLRGDTNTILTNVFVREMKTNLQIEASDRSDVFVPRANVGHEIASLYGAKSVIDFLIENYIEQTTLDTAVDTKNPAFLIKKIQLVKFMRSLLQWLLSNTSDGAITVFRNADNNFQRFIITSGISHPLYREVYWPSQIPSTPVPPKEKVETFRPRIVSDRTPPSDASRLAFHKAEQDGTYDKKDLEAMRERLVGGEGAALIPSSETITTDDNDD